MVDEPIFWSFIVSEMVSFLFCLCSREGETILTTFNSWLLEKCCHPNSLVKIRMTIAVETLTMFLISNRFDIDRLTRSIMNRSNHFYKGKSPWSEIIAKYIFGNVGNKHVRKLFLWLLTTYHATFHLWTLNVYRILLKVLK